MIVVLNLFDIRPGARGRYAEYLRRVQSILDRYGATVLLYGLTRVVYRGSCTQEYCGMVGYPDARALQRFSHDEEFLAIRHLRDESTDNYVLTAVEGFDTLDLAVKHLEDSAD